MTKKNKEKTPVDYYYQVKGLGDGGGFSRWSWPPLVSGKITAIDKKVARKELEDEFGQKLPLRVLSDDDKAPFILHLREIKEDDTRTKSLFLDKECVQCGESFRIIDKYNDVHETDKGTDYCSSSCAIFHRKDNFVSIGSSSSLSTASEDQGYIYKITHKETGKSYIGKTTQSFTLRWHQHFSSGPDTKFKRAINDSSFIDWTFELIEAIKLVDIIDDTKVKPSVELQSLIASHISIREQFWINHYDSISDGYNTAYADKSTAKKRSTQLNLYDKD